MHFDGAGWVRTAGSGFFLHERDARIEGIWVDDQSVALMGGSQVAVWSGAGQIEVPRSPDVSWSDIWGVNSSTWVAVGNHGPDGIAYRADDSLLAKYDPASPNLSIFPGEPLTHVAGSGQDSVHAAGAGGSIYQLHDGAWTLIRDPPASEPLEVLSMQAIGASDLYVLETNNYDAGGDALSRFDGRRCVCPG